MSLKRVATTSLNRLKQTSLQASKRMQEKNGGAEMGISTALLEHPSAAPPHFHAIKKAKQQALTAYQALDQVLNHGRTQMAAVKKLKSA